MIPERFWHLWSRKLAGEASSLELTELDQLMEHYPECRVWVEKLQEQTDAEGDDTGEAEAAFAAVLVQMELSGRLDTGAEEWNPPPPQKKRRLGLVGVASLAIMGLAAGAWLYFAPAKSSEPLAQKNEVVTPKGASSCITLPDKTVVWLNADSRLSYAPDFQTGSREVFLSGEAYFDVTKDSSHPFIIHTEKIDIKVLGTAFNLKSYPDDEVVETSLIHGRVEVTFKDRPAEKIILNPSEKLTVRKDQVQVETRERKPAAKVEIDNLRFLKDSLVEETAWMENKLVFTDEPLARIAKLLERKFNMSVRFANEEVKEYSYTGIFENESLEKILDLMSLSHEFSYSIKGRTVVLGK